MKRLGFILIALAVFCTANADVVTGTVTDTQGEPLIGVSVVVVGTSQGTITDFDGMYSIDADVDAKNCEVQNERVILNGNVHLPWGTTSEVLLLSKRMIAVIQVRLRRRRFPLHVGLPGSVQGWPFGRFPVCAPCPDM